MEFFSEKIVNDLKKKKIKSKIIVGLEEGVERNFAPFKGFLGRRKLLPTRSNGLIQSDWASMERRLDCILSNRFVRLQSDSKGNVSLLVGKLERKDVQIQRVIENCRVVMKQLTKKALHYSRRFNFFLSANHFPSIKVPLVI